MLQCSSAVQQGPHNQFLHGTLGNSQAGRDVTIGAVVHAMEQERLAASRREALNGPQKDFKSLLVRHRPFSGRRAGRHFHGKLPPVASVPLQLSFAQVIDGKVGRRAEQERTRIHDRRCLCQIDQSHVGLLRQVGRRLFTPNDPVHTSRQFGTVLFEQVLNILIAQIHETLKKSAAAVLYSQKTSQVVSRWPWALSEQDIGIIKHETA